MDRSLLPVGRSPRAGSAALAALLLAPLAAGGDCDPPSVGPDIVVAELIGTKYWGTVNGVSGYSQGATACNVGDQPLAWFGSTDQHPLIGQNLYRLEDGRFEQLGLSWMKHGMSAVAGSFCCDCQDPGTLELLGVGCSDPYSAEINGDQDGVGLIGGLGPRSEVDPTTGAFRFPYTTQGLAGDAIYKRVQVRAAELDPALHPDATFYSEIFYVSAAEIAAGNQKDSVSWRELRIGPPGGDGGFFLIATSQTRRRQLALEAWRELDSEVRIELVDVPGDGRFALGSRATPTGAGTWRYEYALHNQDSHRAAGGFVVPLAQGASVGALGFHDVEHHSGEPWDGTDWGVVAQGRELRWSTARFADDPDANALRFGTLYNFRFESDAPPVDGAVQVELFRPGAPDRVAIAGVVPAGPCAVRPTCAALPNSAGAGAQLAASGSPSLAANDLALFLSAAPPGQPALALCGPSGAALPFGDGLLCAGAPRARVGGPFDIALDGTLALPLDLTAPPFTSGPNEARPGATLHLQVWFRDPAGPGGSGFNLSSGLFVAVCP